ncbi:MAG TPA: hypothetical protein VF861_14480 [Telluria sp.]
MVTDAKFAEWLRDSTAQRIALYDFGTETPRKLSSKAYGGALYEAAIAQGGGLRVTQEITPDGQARYAAGEIRVVNHDGSRDGWLDEVWKNAPVTVRIGDVRWAVTDFRTRFSGFVDDVDGSDPDFITIRLRDALQELNTPMTEEKIDGDAVWPLTYGEVPNITPRVLGSGYVYHKGASEGLVAGEARVSGKPRNGSLVTQDTASSTFSLTTALGPGVLTCSVQGDKSGGVYRNTIGALVRLFVTAYGKAPADIDAANFDAFEAAHPQQVGLHLASSTLVLAACAMLASSVQGQLIPSALGALRLVKWGVPAAAVGTILVGDYRDGTLKPVRRHRVAAAVKIAYCRNYTVQPDLQTSILPAHKQWFAQPWRTTTKSDDAVAARYKLTKDPQQEETCLLNLQDADAEATRRLNWRKVQRTTFAFLGTPVALLYEIGEGRTLFGKRWGLAAGKLGQITALTFDYNTFLVDGEITI